MILILLTVSFARILYAMVITPVGTADWHPKSPTFYPNEQNFPLPNIQGTSLQPNVGHRMP